MKKKSCLGVKYVCDKSLSRKIKLAQHIVAIHEGKKPFKCDLCDYSCFDKGSMKKHVSSGHEG